jgi:hypothetical protein
MAVIGNLVANISANAGGFFTVMGAVGGMVESTGRAVGSAAGGIGNAFGSIASSAGSASSSVIRAMGNLTGSVARATATLGQGLGKTINETRLTSAKMKAIQEKTAAQMRKMEAKTVSRGVVGGMLQFHAIAAGVRLVTSSVTGSVQAFRQSEQAGKKLDSVLASTGGAAGVSGDEIRKMASDLQLVTNFEDDATINAAALLATFTQIKGDTFQSAIVAAQDLSSVMGQDLNASIVQVGKALNDPIRGVTALRKVGVSFSKEQQDQIKRLQQSGDLAGAQAIILSELQNEFGGAARAMADPFTIMGNVIGDIMEMIGGALTPALQVLANEVLVVMRTNTEAIQSAFLTLGDILKTVVLGAITSVRAGFITMMTVMGNLGDIAELTFLRIKLSLVTLGNNTAYFFTEQMPAYFDWFLTNWRDIWTTAVNFVGTAFTNMGSNIADSMTEIWDYIASGGTDALEMSWTPLLNGFESTIGELPKIAERIPSEVEAALETQAADLQEKLAGKFAAALAPAVDEAVAPVVQQARQSAETIVDDVEKATKTAEVKTGGVGALQAGTSEAMSAILGAMRRDSDQKEMLRLQQEQTELARDQLDATRDLADADEVVEIP